MCIQNCIDWFDREKRKKIWIDLDNDIEVDTYIRLNKHYELIAILSGLVTSTFGMILDNKNINNEYKYIYSVISGLGLLCSLMSALLSLIITSLLGAVKKNNLKNFIENCYMYFTAPLIFLFLGITFMFISVVLFFGTFVSWILAPFAFFMFIYGIWVYCNMRVKVLKL